MAAGDPEDGEELATTVQQPRETVEAPSDGAFVLAVTAGADKGRTFSIDGTQPSRVLVGQGPLCEIHLDDREVSRRHAALDRVGMSLRITDLGSTNGTFVDRVKVVEAHLQGGELLRVGSTVLRVDRVASASPSAPPLGDGFGRVIGSSPQMRRLYPLCHGLASATVPVVIEGETGTGKEVLAEALHELGPRALAPFVVFDCTATTPSLIESELFGHERGAFTGAVAVRKGLFEQAQGGTLLIDEIGELDLSVQPKLLRAIERSEVRRVGADRPTRFDVRVLAATRRDLDREVQAGRFRDDLFHRLAVARIEMPPLRHRQGDVTKLACAFWQELRGDPQGPPADLLARWEEYAWPGNVRELRNAAAHHLALGDLAHLALDRKAAAGPNAPVTPAPSTAPDFVDRIIVSGAPFPRARDRVLEEFEQRFVAHVLAQHGGDVAAAASASGIGRRYFQKLRARAVK